MAVKRWDTNRITLFGLFAGTALRLVVEAPQFNSLEWWGGLIGSAVMGRQSLRPCRERET
jgi:hypothetical protein